jgi:hypothetical protein
LEEEIASIEELLCSSLDEETSKEDELLAAQEARISSSSFSVKNSISSLSAQDIIAGTPMSKRIEKAKIGLVRFIMNSFC